MRIRIRDPESFWSWIRDGKNSDQESGINIPDPQHWLPGYCFQGRWKAGGGGVVMGMGVDRETVCVLCDREYRGTTLYTHSYGVSTLIYQLNGK